MQVCIGGPAGLALVSSQNENEETRIDLSDLQTGPREKGGCWRGRTLPSVNCTPQSSFHCQLY